MSFSQDATLKKDLSSLQLHTSVKATSGSVQISAASLSHGSATVRTTVVISLMKTLPTAPPGPAALDSSSAATDVASPRVGSVMSMMTAVTTLTNLWRNAVSDNQT